MLILFHDSDVQLDAFDAGGRGDAEQIGQANFLFCFQQHLCFAGGFALLDCLLDALFLLGDIGNCLAFFAVADVRRTIDLPSRLRVTVKTTAVSASSASTCLAVGKLSSPIGDGDKRHEEVDVHHEHEVDHRRDIELGRLGVEPTGEERVGAGFTKTEARRFHGMRLA